MNWRKKEHLVRLYLYKHDPNKILKMVKKYSKVPYQIVSASEVVWEYQKSAYEYSFSVKNSEACIEFMGFLSNVVHDLGYKSEDTATYLKDFGRGKYHISGTVK